MGCDIHMVLEKKVTGSFDHKWVGVHNFPYLSDSLEKPKLAEGAYWFPSWIAGTRCYDLFGHIAGIRGGGPAVPKGLPKDISDLAQMEVNGWGSDGHSHTWLTLREATPLFLAYYGQEQLLTEDRFQFCASLFAAEVNEDEDIDLYRLIIWFDN